MGGCRLQALGLPSGFPAEPNSGGHEQQRCETLRVVIYDIRYPWARRAASR